MINAFWRHARFSLFAQGRYIASKYGKAWTNAIAADPLEMGLRRFSAHPTWEHDLIEIIPLSHSMQI